jgi:hypothetical protein
VEGSDLCLSQREMDVILCMYVCIFLTLCFYSSSKVWKDLPGLAGPPPEDNVPSTAHHAIHLQFNIHAFEIRAVQGPKCIVWRAVDCTDNSIVYGEMDPLIREVCHFCTAWRAAILYLRTRTLVWKKVYKILMFLLWPTMTKTATVRKIKRN